MPSNPSLLEMRKGSEFTSSITDFPCNTEFAFNGDAESSFVKFLSLSLF